MKRFWKQATAEPVGGVWQVHLDGRPLKTQGGGQQLVPGRALADLLAEEWNAQGENVEPAAFPLRDLADFAIDRVQPNSADTIERLLRYAETDTLCYRAEPEDALFQRQEQLWEPLLSNMEQRLQIHMRRVAGIMPQPQPEASIAAIRGDLRHRDAFTLSALNALAPLAASLCVALAAVEPGADAAHLFAIANAEEDWQAEQWGWDWQAEEERAIRLKAFTVMAKFAAASRSGQPEQA